MDTARFLRMRDIFDRALQLPEDQRLEFVERECQSDTSMRSEIGELWSAHLAAAGATDARPTASGDRLIGPYRILGRLGEGGMGTVYLAVRNDGAFQKQVALKLLRPDQASGELIRRFHQERQVLANLDHPNIARILDGGQTPEGLPYYVMEYVQGSPLDRFCDQRKIDLAGRVRLVQQVCHAVQYLHENLVVHRDLKPSNIFVTEEGSVKLLDFGIAKLQIASVSEPTVPFNRLMTPGHASPEQLSGAPVSRASDIYSLGLILYQLLTGTLPFADPLAKLRTDPPPASLSIREDLSRTPETTDQLRRRVVGDLDNIVMMCLRRDPRQRYDTAREFAEDLQRFLEGRSVSARPGHITERAVKFLKRNRVAAAVCALVLILGLFGTWQTVRAQMETHRVEAGEREIAGLLDKLNRSKALGSHTEDVRKLRQTLERNLPPSSGNNSERADLLNRSLQYLNTLRPFAAQDTALAQELADAYRTMASLAGSAYPEISQAALQAALETLGAAAPAAATAERQPAYPIQPPHTASRSVAQTPDAPPAEWRRLGTSDPSTPGGGTVEPPSPPANNAALRQISLRLDQVSAEVAAAEENYLQNKQNLQAQGLSIHPESTKAYNNMKSALDRARRELDAVQLDSAEEDLNAAAAYAKRVN